MSRLVIVLSSTGSLTVVVTVVESTSFVLATFGVVTLDNSSSRVAVVTVFEIDSVLLTSITSEVVEPSV